MENETFTTSLLGRVGRPDAILTIDDRIPVEDSPYALGGGVAVVKSFDPVVLSRSDRFCGANVLAVAVPPTQ